MLVQFVCPSGHTWDAWGTFVTAVNGKREFMPDDLRTYLCPTCDQLKARVRDPEVLS